MRVPTGCRGRGVRVGTVCDTTQHLYCQGPASLLPGFWLVESTGIASPICNLKCLWLSLDVVSEWLKCWNCPLETFAMSKSEFLPLCFKPSNAVSISHEPLSQNFGLFGLRFDGKYIFDDFELVCAVGLVHAMWIRVLTTNSRKVFGFQNFTESIGAEHKLSK